MAVNASGSQVIQKKRFMLKKTLIAIFNLIFNLLLIMRHLVIHLKISKEVGYILQLLIISLHE